LAVARSLSTVAESRTRSYGTGLLTERTACENLRVSVVALEIGRQTIDAARLEDICTRYGIAELAVFGSVARGEAAPTSDVDLLYVLHPGARLGFAIDDLEDELADLFGRRVTRPPSRPCPSG
jgi:predicted nucleotidyltransferase